MDSLVANYASSDEEGEEQPTITDFSSTNSTSFIFPSLPHPKKQPPQNPNFEKPPTTSTSIFSSLPQPQLSTTKRVVKFTPPIIKSDTIDDDDDDEQKQAEKRKQSQSQYQKNVDQSSSVKSFLSSIPAPKSSATLGVASSGRRSLLETQQEVPAFTSTKDTVSDQTVGSYSNYEQSVGNYANHEQSCVNYEVGSDQNVNYEQSCVNYEVGSDQNVNYDQSCVNYEVGSDQNVDSYSWGVDQNMQTSYVNYGAAGNGMVPRKRGRNEIPTEIIEVKQDELTKNRPREDQVKLTGIAFGPSYQPVSTKGKPSKLHKRKHQIGSLYYDMKQKETELSERRAKGFLTKAQTHGKYGW